MGFSSRRAWSLGLVLGALSIMGTGALAAQQPAKAAPAKPAAASKPAAAAPAPDKPATAVADPELTQFAKAYVAVGLVRDDYDAQLALPKNKTVELQAQLREEMKKKVEQAVQAAGMTMDAYRRVEYTVTVDPARRAAFDQILAAANAG